MFSTVQMILPLGQLAYLFCSKALLVKDIGEKKKEYIW